MIDIGEELRSRMSASTICSEIILVDLGFEFFICFLVLASFFKAFPEVTSVRIHISQNPGFAFVVRNAAPFKMGFNVFRELADLSWFRTMKPWCDALSGERHAVRRILVSYEERLRLVCFD